MPSRVLKTTDNLRAWVRFLETCNLPMTVSQVSGEKRTDAMNRTIHMWFGEIAVFRGDTSAQEVKAECNLQYGLPIMARDDPEWMDVFGYLFRGLDHARKLKAIRILDVPFTRRMKVKQLSEYMDQMQRDYREMGVYLTDPELRGYEEMVR